MIGSKRLWWRLQMGTSAYAACRFNIMLDILEDYMHTKDYTYR